MAFAALSAELYEVRWWLLSTVILLYGADRYRAYLRLRAFKGPFSTGWSELWHISTCLSGRSYLLYKEVCDKYGPIARIGPNDLVTTSPELVAHINAARSPYVRTKWFFRAVRFESGKDNVFSQLDEEQHTKRRHQMAAGYSGKENSALESSIDKHVQELLNLIRTKYISSQAQAKPVDVAQKIQYFTLDVISAISYGQAFGDLKTDSDNYSYIKVGEEGMAAIIYVIAFGLAPLLQWGPIYKLCGPSEKDKTGFGKMMALARAAIDKRLNEPKDEKSDMLTSFQRHGLSRDDLVSESIVQIVAGSDTSATAIRSIILYLVNHPPACARLQAEIDEAVRADNLPASTVISDATARNLPYLQAVVREGLRLHPPATHLLPKVVPKNGETVQVNGKPVFLPGGTNVGVSIWGIQRNKEVFGADAELFRPERWLLDENKTNLDQLSAMKRVNEMVFGHGKWQCLGKSVAWMEITKAVFELFRHFDWSIANPERPMRENNYLGVFGADQMWALATEREPKAL